MTTNRGPSSEQQKTAAIIGAGVMGLCASAALKQRGYTVKVFDPDFEFCAQTQKFSAPKNASAMAGGMLAPYAEIDHMPANFIAAGLHSITLWDQFLPPEYVHKKGSLVIAHPEDQHMLTRFAAYFKTIDEIHTLNRAELTELEPALGMRFQQGLWLQQEAHLDPLQAMNYLCQQIDTIIPQSASPEILAADFSVAFDCRGMGAAPEQKDLRGVKGEILTLHNPDFMLQRPVRLMHPRYPLYIVPRAGYIFTIGATQIESQGHEYVAVRSALELLSAAYSLHPSFADAEILDMRAGTRPTYNSNLPRLNKRGNIISCNGLFRHGWLLAPMMAECAASMLDGASNPYISLFMEQPVSERKSA